MGLLYVRTYWGRDIVAIAIANSFVGAELSEQRSIGPTPNCGRIRFGNGELRLVLLYIMGVPFGSQRDMV